MAATIFTPHYGIAKYGPQGDATPMDVYGVYNPAMDTIDQILFDLKGDIDALKQRVAALEQQVESILNRLTGIENRLTNVEGDVENIKNDIENIKNTVADLDEIKQRVTNLENSVSQIQQQLTTINNSITELRGVDTNIWAAIRNILAHVHGGGTVNVSNGDVTFGTDGIIAVGNMNLYNDDGARYIVTTASNKNNPGVGDVLVE